MRFRVGFPEYLLRHVYVWKNLYCNFREEEIHQISIPYNLFQVNLYFSVKLAGLRSPFKMFLKQNKHKFAIKFSFCLEAFSATEMNKTFWNRQPCQDVTFRRRFMDWLRPHLHVVAGGWVEPQPISDISCGSTKPSATPRSHPLKRRQPVASWCGWLLVNISLTFSVSLFLKVFWNRSQFHIDYV